LLSENNVKTHQSCFLLPAAPSPPLWTFSISYLGNGVWIATATDGHNVANHFASQQNTARDALAELDKKIRQGVDVQAMDALSDFVRCLKYATE